MLCAFCPLTEELQSKPGVQMLIEITRANGILFSANLVNRIQWTVRVCDPMKMKLIKTGNFPGMKPEKPENRRLAAELELLGDRLIAANVGHVEIIQQTAALADHHEQSATGAVVFVILLQMFGQRVDAFGQEGDLHVSRPCVALVNAKSFDGLSFFHSSVQSILIFKGGI
jgi:hypothetical protein